MSTKVKSDPKASLMEYIPHYRCPCCESAVRREHVFITQRRPRYDLVEHRTVTIYCEPCDQAHKVTQERPVGTTIWEDAGKVERLEGAHRRGILTRVEQVNGDLQRMAS